MFSCNKCKTLFKTKFSFERHQNRKTSCVKESIKCSNCLKEFKTNQQLNNHLNRKFKCEKVDLVKENIELKHQLEIAKLHQINNITINNVNNVNNIKNEVIFRMDSDDLEKMYKKCIKNDLTKCIANYEVDGFQYTNDDIKDIDTFRMFYKLIFNNNEYPQNKTIMYNIILDQFYYHLDNEWKPFDNNKLNILIKIILDRIRQFVQIHKPFARKNYNELYFYVDDKPIEEEAADKYTNILKLNYKNKFDFHESNKK